MRYALNDTGLMPAQLAFSTDVIAELMTSRKIGGFARYAIHGQQIVNALTISTDFHPFSDTVLLTIESDWVKTEADHWLDQNLDQWVATLGNHKDTINQFITTRINNLETDPPSALDQFQEISRNLSFGPMGIVLIEDYLRIAQESDADDIIGLLERIVNASRKTSYQIRNAN